MTYNFYVFEVKKKERKIPGSSEFGCAPVCHRRLVEGAPWVGEFFGLLGVLALWILTTSTAPIVRQDLCVVAEH